MQDARVAGWKRGRPAAAFTDRADTPAATAAQCSEAGAPRQWPYCPTRGQTCILRPGQSSFSLFLHTRLMQVQCTQPIRNGMDVEATMLHSSYSERFLEYYAALQHIHDQICFQDVNMLCSDST